MNNLLENLNRRFDHAALMPEVDEAAVRRLCQEAIEHEFYTVAVNPVWVKTAADELRGGTVKILSVAGFPLSASRTDIKLAEAVKGVNDGAHEIDMVANVGWLVSGRYKEVEAEITEIRRNLPFNVVLKVIIEAGKLSTEQQISAVKCVVDGGAQFVKTCTGFFGGATVEQAKTLFQAANGKVEVKASGGIRTLQQCRELLAAGATRLGSSSSVAIIKEMEAARA